VLISRDLIGRFSRDLIGRFSISFWDIKLDLKIDLDLDFGFGFKNRFGLDLKSV